MKLPAPLSALGRRLRERPESILLLVGLLWAVWAVVSLVGPAASNMSTTDADLLRGLRPTESQGMTRERVMTDGIRPKDGGDWDSGLTAVFNRDGFAIYDLGTSKEIRAAYVQGDGNDDYIVSTSEDGSKFETLWASGRAKDTGMQPRSTTELSGRGRYVRITGRGGDGRFSIGEIQLFSEAPAALPVNVTVRSGLPNGDRIRGHLLHFVLAMGVFLFAARRDSSLLWKLLAGVAPLAAGAITVAAIIETWPVEALVVSMTRAASAGIAAIALLREVIAPKRFPASRATVIAALTFSAALAVGSFYNLGRFQFRDDAHQRQTFVHTYDMRVYYPVAKYFPELRFDGLYLASTAAVLSDVPGTTRAKLANVRFRDLKTHKMVRAGDVWDEVLGMEGRFTPERWQAFLKDMRYFRLTMGPDYLGSMVDHGGNATPVWLAEAYLLFKATEATEPTLVWTGLLDPLLLLIAFIAIGKAYGWRASLLCAVVFGANDFVMLGSNWAGSTLRHDWLAYLMMAIAALKKERYVLGGILLAMASAARAFPVLALVGMAFPVLGWLAGELRAKRGWPKASAWLLANRDTLRVWLSAAAAGAALFLFSSLILSFSAWPEWLHKVRLLDTQPHLNQVSLQALVAGTDFAQGAILRARTPLFLFLAAMFTVSIGAVAYRRSLDQAAILGCLLIPVLFNPANYYIHFITILPLLAWTQSAKDQPDAPSWNQAVVGLGVLGLCIAQYWTTKVTDGTLHFEMATAMLFATFGTMLIACYRADAFNTPLLGTIGADGQAEGQADGQAKDEESKDAGSDSNERTSAAE